MEAHLARCTRCRTERDDIVFAAGLMREIARVMPPDALWTRLDRQMGAPQPSRAWAPRLALAIAVAVLAVTSYRVVTRPTDRPWAVARLDNGAAPAQMAEGEWVETGDSARARITVGDIGTVDVEPRTRVRLGTIGPEQYRLALARGSISALIAAPPRLFIVDTPASTVVDLGCAYTISVDEEGTGHLRVTSGWAALEWNGRESLVPAGAQCRIRPSVGPGTPFFDDAPAELQRAVESFDFGNGGAAAVATILVAARPRDTLTLWHLLSRVNAAERARVYDRIAALAPVPPEVTREQALQLDADTLTRWREELAWTW